MTNIFAYTAPGAEYPEYLSVNVRDGQLEVTVRGLKKPPDGERAHALPGDTAALVLPIEEHRKLYRALLDYLIRDPID